MKFDGVVYYSHFQNDFVYVGLLYHCMFDMTVRIEDELILRLHYIHGGHGIHVSDNREREAT